MAQTALMETLKTDNAKNTIADIKNRLLIWRMPIFYHAIAQEKDIPKLRNIKKIFGFCIIFAIFSFWIIYSRSPTRKGRTNRSQTRIRRDNIRLYHLAIRNNRSGSFPVLSIKMQDSTRIKQKLDQSLTVLAVEVRITNVKCGLEDLPKPPDNND